MPLKCTGGKGHRNKKKADMFLHVNLKTLHNRKTMSYTIAHGLTLKVNISLSLITPVLACIENSNM